MNTAPATANYLTIAQTPAGPLPTMVTPGEGAVVLTAGEYIQRRDAGMEVRIGAERPDLFSLADFVIVPADCAHSGCRTRYGRTGALRSGYYLNGERQR